jgi:hypothetical protein
MPKDFKKGRVESLRELGKWGRWKTWVYGWGVYGYGMGTWVGVGDMWVGEYMGRVGDMWVGIHGHGLIYKYIRSDV